MSDKSPPVAPPPFAPLVARLPSAFPFIPPEVTERALGRPFEARLGANESGFGPSEAVLDALRGDLGEIWKYGDALSGELRAALADLHGIAPETILVGEGIDGLLGLLARVMLSPGDNVVTSHGGYPTFNYHVTGQGAHLHAVPYAGDHENPEGLSAEAARVNARLTYVVNPDNPMGSWIKAGRIEAMLDHLPASGLLVLDEAYAEFAPDAAIPPLRPYDGRMIRLRTFSKAYALAGMRIGYAIGHPDLLAGFDRVRNHFGVTRLAQTAALAAVRDTAGLARTLDLTAQARTRIGHIAQSQGFTPLPSATNFVAVDCGRDGAFTARLTAALMQRGVFVRMPGVAPLNRCLRIGVGTEAALDCLARELPGAIAEASA